MIVAAAAFVILGVYSWRELDPGKPNLSGDTGNKEIESGYYPGGDACNPSAVGPFPYGEGPSNAITCKEAREKYRLETNDLEQQRRSADAAEAAARASYAQSKIAFWGAAISFLTLIAAVAAAIYAGVAAHAAKEAARYTRRAVRLTREHGEAELCAYCIVERADLKTYVHDLVIEFTVKNIGETVAKDVQLSGDFISEKVLVERDAISTRISTQFGTIYPSDTAREWANVSEWSFDRSVRNRLIAGDHEARSVIFNFSWEDIFGRVHTASYKMATRDVTRETYIQSHTLKGSEVLLPLWRGNYSVSAIPQRAAERAKGQST